jgi:hypothetical protein
MPEHQLQEPSVLYAVGSVPVFRHSVLYAVGSVPVFRHSLLYADGSVPVFHHSLLHNTLAHRPIPYVPCFASYHIDIKVTLKGT